MGRGAVLVGGGDDGGGRSGGRDGSMGSGGPGLGRNPSKGENLRGLQEKPRQSQEYWQQGREVRLFIYLGTRAVGPQTTKQPVTDVQELGSHNEQEPEASL